MSTPISLVLLFSKSGLIPVYENNNPFKVHNSSTNRNIFKFVPRFSCSLGFAWIRYQQLDMISLSSPWVSSLMSFQYDEQAPYYFTLALVLVILVIFSTFQFSGKKRIALPIYPEGPNREDAKKRWLTDSINLLQEGYKKVRFSVYSGSDTLS